MKKEQLRSGYILTKRNGEKGVLVGNNKITSITNEILFSLLSDYDKDLKHAKDKYQDIIAVGVYDINGEYVKIWKRPAELDTLENNDVIVFKNKHNGSIYSRHFANYDGVDLYVWTDGKSSYTTNEKYKMNLNTNEIVEVIKVK